MFIDVINVINKLNDFFLCVVMLVVDQTCL